MNTKIKFIYGLLPFAWYLFLFNPSGVHHFFTNKACVTTAFAGLSALTRLCIDAREPVLPTA